MGRAPCCQKVGLKRGRWTADEDQILIKYIQDNGEGSWRSLPKNAGLLRCGKSCRLRWINYLRTDLKRGNISPQEEDLIIKLHATLGNRWSLIASQLSGRTDNEIKNHWNSHLRRSINTWRRPVNDTLPQYILDNLAQLMVKPNPSTKQKSNKNNAPTTEEIIKPDEIGGNGNGDGYGDDNNDKPQTPDVCKETPPIRNAWSEQSFQSTFTLEDQQLVEEEELEMAKDPLFEVGEDYCGELLSLNEAVPLTHNHVPLMMHQYLSSNEIQSPTTFDLSFMNDLTDFSSISHIAEMAGSPTMKTNTTKKPLPSPSPSPSPSSSSLYTFDQLMNIASSDWNWEDYSQTPDQDLMNHEVASLMSWLWDGDEV
ncbi:unnamed protein product [Rhodiola kirilowii]